MVLALSLTACGGETEPPETEGDSSVTGALSGGKGNVSEPKDDPDDPEKAEAGLVLLRACMAEDDQLAGAVAYLGQREPNDRSSMTEWLLENSGDLCLRAAVPAGDPGGARTRRRERQALLHRPPGREHQPRCKSCDLGVTGQRRVASGGRGPLSGRIRAACAGIREL